jgi:D-sedoheptulose 7-phosphate isomerase
MSSLPPVVILAGGLATRMRPATEKIPKALLELAGRPFIAWQLELLREKGVTQAVVCAGYLGNMIQDYAGDGSKFGVAVSYSFDGDKLLGTGGAVKKAMPLLPSGPFFIMYGDSYLDTDFRAVYDFFLRSGKKSLMTVFHNCNSFDKSNIIFRDGIIVKYDKKDVSAEMEHVDYGLGLVRPDVFDGRPDNEPFDLASLYGDLVRRGETAGFEIKERFYETGSFKGLEETEKYILSKKEQKKMSGCCCGDLKSHIDSYMADVAKIAAAIDKNAIEKMVRVILKVRESHGRLFILGVGGSAANASHAVNDFRKIAGIESYTPTDNASELTARVNDDGWDSAFANWLKGSRLSSKDCVFVLSVGGGNAEKNVSVNLVKALLLAREVGASVIGIVGRDGGYTAKVADACVIVPTVNPETVTPHAEAFQGTIWHLIASHPAVKANEMKWEAVK